LTIVHGGKLNEFEKPSLSDFYTDIGLIIFQYLVRCFVAKKTNKEKISPFKTIKKQKIDIPWVRKKYFIVTFFGVLRHDKFYKNIDNLKHFSAAWCSRP